MESTQNNPELYEEWKACTEKIIVHVLTNHFDYFFEKSRDFSADLTLSELVKAYTERFIAVYREYKRFLGNAGIIFEHETGLGRFDAMEALKRCVRICEAMPNSSSDDIWNSIIEPCVQRCLALEN